MGLSQLLLCKEGCNFGTMLYNLKLVLQRFLKGNKRQYILGVWSVWTKDRTTQDVKILHNNTEVANIVDGVLYKVCPEGYLEQFKISMSVTYRIIESFLYLYLLKYSI